MHIPAESSGPAPETQAVTRSYPFEFCDRILAQTPDSMEALKTITSDEWCLAGTAPLPLWAVVEIMSQCPTYFGRRNRQGDAVDMLKNMQKITTPIGSKAKEDHPELIERGVFVRKELPEYCAAYDTVIQRAKEGK